MSAFINRSFLLGIILLAACTNNQVKDSSSVAQEKGSPSAAQGNDSYYGTWTVKKYKFGNSVVAFDNEEKAAKYVNKKIILSADKAEIFGDQCAKPSYEITRHNTRDLFDNEFNESDTTLIPSMDSVTVNVVTCLSEPEATNPDSLNFVYFLVFLNKKEMIAHANGAYFFLNKE